MGIPVVAFCSCGDDGGSSKYFREFGLLPPGDYWKLIMGASRYPGRVYNELSSLLFYRFDNDGPLKEREFRDLIEIAMDERGVAKNSKSLRILYEILSPDYRFEVEVGNGTKGHSVGNILLAALMFQHRNLEGIRLLEEGLDSAVRCIPVSKSPYTLHIVTEDGDSVIGECSLDEDRIIPRVKNVNHVKSDGGKIDINPEVLTELSKLKRLSLCATSMVANHWGVILPEIRDYLKTAAFPIDYWSNLMTEQNQTHYLNDGFVTRFDFTEHVILATEIIGRVPDVVIAHDYGLPSSRRRKIPKYIMARYSRKNSAPVQCTDIDKTTFEAIFEQRFGEVPVLLRRDIAMVDVDIDRRQKVIRHNPRRVASVFRELLGMSCGVE